MDQIVGIELDALKDEVVQDVEGEEGRVEEDAEIGVVAKAVVVVHGPGEGVERQHRPPDDIEIHLDVDAVVEERQLLGPPCPQRQVRMLDRAWRLAEHRHEGKDRGEDRAAGHRIDRGPVEPIPRHPGELERPHDQRDGKHQQTVEPIGAGCTGGRIDDVAGNPSSWQEELRQEKHGEDHQRGEKPRNRFRPGKLEEVANPQPFNHGRIPLRPGTWALWSSPGRRACGVPARAAAADRQGDRTSLPPRLTTSVTGATGSAKRTAPRSGTPAQRWCVSAMFLARPARGGAGDLPAASASQVPRSPGWPCSRWRFHSGP